MLAKPKPERPLRRKLHPEFNESDEGEKNTHSNQAQIDSKTKELLKKGFGSYDVGIQRIYFDWQSQLKMIEAERKKSWVVVSQTV